MKIFGVLFLFITTLVGQDALEPVIPVKEINSYREIVKLVEEKPAEALAELAKLPATRSSAFDYLEGAILHQENKVIEAEKAFLKALKKFPAYYRVHNSLSILYSNKNDWNKALKHLYEVVKSGRADGKTWKNIVYCHINNGNLHAAEESLENVRIFMPEDKSLDKKFLEIYLQQQNYEKALPLAQELLKKNPQEKRYWNIVISGLQNLDKAKEALQNYLLYERLFKLENRELMELAGMLFDNQLYTQAADRFSKVTGELQIEALLNKAICYSQIGSHAKVVSSLSKKLEKASPKQNEKFYLLRGNAYLEQANPGAAKQEYLEALKYNSSNAQIQFNLAQIYDNEKDYEKALERYHNASKNNFYASSCFMRKARIYILQKEYKLALIEADKAREIDESSSVENFYQQVAKLAGI